MRPWEPLQPLAKYPINLNYPCNNIILKGEHFMADEDIKDAHERLDEAEGNTAERHREAAEAHEDAAAAHREAGENSEESGTGLFGV
jgi:hypothetical protein